MDESVHGVLDCARGRPALVGQVVGADVVACDAVPVAGCFGEGDQDEEVQLGEVVGCVAQDLTDQAAAHASAPGLRSVPVSEVLGNGVFTIFGLVLGWLFNRGGVLYRQRSVIKDHLDVWQRLPKGPLRARWKARLEWEVKGYLDSLDRAWQRRLRKIALAQAGAGVLLLLIVVVNLSTDVRDPVMIVFALGGAGAAFWVAWQTWKDAGTLVQEPTRNAAP